ncbi:MAG: copper resistance protein CopC [Rhodospirillales bacterium]|nr:copper resistance protein CopC [Rhodospirillales bacterium]
MRRSLFAGAAMVMLAIAPAAFAHAYLTTSKPSAGTTVRLDTSSIRLSFTEAVQPEFCAVTVVDGMGTHAETGKPEAVPGHDDELTVPVHFQMAGKYIVTWHALSVDTHKTHGTYSFIVGN